MVIDEAPQISLFDGTHPLRITKRIALTEFFAGYGSQSLSLKYLGVPFDHYKIAEWAIPSIKAYKDIHFPDDDTDYSAGLADDEVFDYLKGGKLSADYSNPIPDDKLRKRKDLREIYNSVIASHNLMSIVLAKGSDFDLDADHTHVWCYSFPCQDLSKAGRQKGMSRDSDTRSGMLWQVERILKEMVADGKRLPDILLMENVPDVCGTKNIADFHEWIAYLDSIGYISKYEIMNAKHYGVPQNRERCFMVSWRDADAYYDFPKPVPLEKRLKDLLEKNVDEKYYLSDAAIKYISAREGNFCRTSTGEGIAQATVTAKGNANNTGNFIDETGDYCESFARSQSLNVEREREREREVSNTVRTGGRASLDAKHSWDIIVESRADDRTPDGCSNDADGTGCERIRQSNGERGDGVRGGIAILDGYNKTVKGLDTSGTLTTNSEFGCCGVFGVVEKWTK